MVINTNEREPKVPNNKVINGLVRKAFGLFVRGDMASYGTTAPEWLPTGYLTHLGDQPRLGYIVGASRFFLCSDAITEIGRFTDQSGSKLEVKPEFRERANKYAALYHNLFGNEVEISFVA